MYNTSNLLPTAKKDTWQYIYTPIVENYYWIKV